MSTFTPLTISITPLNNLNYSVWKLEITALLRTKGLFRLVNGQSPRPDSKPENADKLETYLDKLEQAAGLLVLTVDQQQRVHLSGIEDDPIQIWRKLEEVHMNKQAGTRFNAYDDLFSIRLQESESLSSLITRVDAVMNRIQGLRPSDFDIKQMDEELAIMALIRALPQEQYGSFVSSLLLQKDLSKADVQSAFKNEETNRKPRSSPAVSVDAALKASSSLPNSSKPKVKCDFCDRTNHSTSECRGLQAYKKKKAENQQQKQVQAHTTSSTPTQATPGVKPEYAGNASFLSSSSSEPVSDDWLVDSGATCHMTPHRHWFHTYVS